MVKRSVKESLFFILIAALFFLGVKASEYWMDNSSTAKKWEDMTILIVGIILALLLAAVYYASKLNRCGEGFWEVSPAARCKGGPYMWQGDSETAKMCREMASSEAGRCSIASYNCPKGFIGQPRLPFYYTPLSGDGWENERCGHPVGCKCMLAESLPKDAAGFPGGWNDSNDGLAAWERLVPYDLNDPDRPKLCQKDCQN